MTRRHFFKPAEEFRDPYRYKACGLDNIYLLNGYDVEEHDGEKHVFVRNMEELHKAIGCHITPKRKGRRFRMGRFGEPWAEYFGMG
jgi:hypothetical protein